MVCHRIAGDAGTEFGGKQKLNLWELSQRCLHLREQQLCDKLYSGKIDPAANPLFPFPIPASSNDGKVSVRESTDLSNFQLHHRCTRLFSGCVYLTLSSITTIDYHVINDMAQAEKLEKKSQSNMHIGKDCICMPWETSNSIIPRFTMGWKL